jgi:hypothetical protein
MNKKFYYTQGCKELRDFINSIGITYVSGDISRYGYYFDGENIVHDNLSLLHGMSNYIYLELDEFIEYIKNVLNIKEAQPEPKTYYTRGCESLRLFFRQNNIDIYGGEESFGYYFEGDEIKFDSFDYLKDLNGFVFVELNEFIARTSILLDIKEALQVTKAHYAIMVDGKQTLAMLYDSIEEARELAKKMALKELRTTSILQCIERVEILTETIKM